MRAASKTIWLLLLVAAFGAAAYSGLLSKTVWHYRMTVAVETPEGLKSGSAVRAVIYGGPTTGGGGPGLDLKVNGEAVMVDLGKRGILFGLLSGRTQGYDYGSDILLRAFNKKGDVTLRPSQVPKTGKVTLEPDQYPVFVRFRDMNDPKTIAAIHETAAQIRKFYPDKKIETFEEAFGKGVHLKEVTIEMTDEPLTRNLDKVLPSFGPETGFVEWFKKLPYGDVRRIGLYDFKRGER
ncbi:MAG: hypothetical protein EPN97_00650 [Alphaproteobacteria bacterium]|nr:MAG: hypothetical protein EPN97_00650 [Alphaproteobacteria bacterium]